MSDTNDSEQHFHFDREMLRQFLNVLPNPVCIKDKDHRYIDFNYAFCALKGCTEEELVGKTDFEISPDDEARLSAELDDQTLATKSGLDKVKQITAADGQKRWVESRRAYIETESGVPLILLTLSDITDLKEREAALDQAKQAAIESGKAKSEFLANMSHEIRTPMNGVLGMAQILKMTQLNPEQTDIVESLERSSEALLTVINDILDFSKMEAGKFEISPAPFNLRQSIEDVAALLGRSAGEKGIEFITKIPDNLPMNLIGDASRLRQVLLNLIGNGIKFTDNGYVALEVSGDDLDEDVALKFSVTDTGIGIAPEKLNSIFNKFEQVDSSATRAHGGTGLGLAITQNLVEMMGGTVDVSSELGQGSVFSFELKLSKSDEATSADLEFLPDPSLDIFDRKILIIDDIEINRDILTRRLKSFSTKIFQAKSAHEAARMLARAVQANDPFDLVVSDFQMPKVDGLQFVRALRTKREFLNLPILILSSVDSPAVRAEFDRLNVQACLVKPVRLGVLEKEISRILSATSEPKIPHVETSVSTAPKTNKRMPLSGPAPTGGYRLLVAEDNMINQDVLRGLLAGEPYVLDFARNGAIALEQFKRGNYDIVLMDISMPVMDGLDATKAVREYEAANGLDRTPIIALTAHALEQERRKFLAAGMDDIVLKPIEIEILDTKLCHWLGRRDAVKVA